MFSIHDMDPPRRTLRGRARDFWLFTVRDRGDFWLFAVRVWFLKKLLTRAELDCLEASAEDEPNQFAPFWYLCRDWADEEAVTDAYRGHPMRLEGDAWVYIDNGQSVAEHWQERGCGHCGLPDTPEGYDGCLGHVPGAMNACCGHGNPRDAYVQLRPKVVKS